METSHSIGAIALAVALAGGAGTALGQDPSTRSGQAASTGSEPALSLSKGQAWPVKPIRMIVPFTAGSASDVLGRIVGQRLTEIWGQQIVMDNRPGAGGLIGSELTRQGTADGGAGSARIGAWMRPGSGL